MGKGVRRSWPRAAAGCRLRPWSAEQESHVVKVDDGARKGIEHVMADVTIEKVLGGVAGDGLREHVARVEHGHGVADHEPLTGQHPHWKLPNAAGASTPPRPRDRDRIDQGAK